MAYKRLDDFGARATLEVGGRSYNYYRLGKLEEDGVAAISKLPFSIKVLVEAMLRNNDGFAVTKDDVVNMAQWNAANPAEIEVPFKPARVILQDFTGVPAVVDLAAMRSAMAALGGDPQKINPLVPVDLVIDHSVQVDQFGSKMALFFNAEREFERNVERYEFLKWGQKAFDNFRVVPPETGIVHQVNLEYLANVVQVFEQEAGDWVALPDSLVGTDSHTTMINGLGVVGWGVGGIEAEAVMLGQPIYMLLPQVIGFKLTGKLSEGTTATDLTLTVTEMLRKKGVVGKFVEFYGPGIANMALADRATIANMAPEYGATMGFFPIDSETLNYLRSTGRPAEVVELVEAYAKAQGLFLDPAAPEAVYTDTLELDLSTVVPSVAGPKRPQDRVALTEHKAAFEKALIAPIAERGFALEAGAVARTAEVKDNGHSAKIGHGAVVIAAITSCTNTSNPSVMLGAGLVAKKAVERGLHVPAHVKTSLAPGSRVVSNYLDAAGLTVSLEALGFHIVGYGCTTCIGNSGPLPESVASAVQEGELVASAVLSGNRNFEGRINPLVKASYLMSPPLVVAYALAGTVDIDLLNEPLGQGTDGPVYLRDVWPTHEEIQAAVRQSVKPEMFAEQYSNVFEGKQAWNEISIPEGELYAWNAASTYIQHPPFFQNLSSDLAPLQSIHNARALVVVGDSVTTDHISPAGSIAVKSPAGEYLMGNGVEPREFNSYGSRRGNHEVMMRGTFANIRLKNQLLPGTEGAVTEYLPSGEQTSIYDASMRYQANNIPLVILAGKEYGTGSSRDWAAKGTYLLGVKAVIAESFERIHRSNLVGMGVLPLQFQDGESWQTLGLTGRETFSIEGITDELQPRSTLIVKAVADDDTVKEFETRVRIDTPVEIEYYKNGGILHTVLRELAK